MNMEKEKIRASVIGASGYSGLELLKLLNNHKYVDVQIATSDTYGKRIISEAFPSFCSNKKNPVKAVLSFTPLEDLGDDSFSSSDVVFMCLPSLKSMEFVNKYLRGFKGKIIDIGSDFRIKDEKDFELWYGKPHTAGLILKEFVYGLPEIYEEKIKNSRYIANPGCYPTSILLGLAPLLSCKDLVVDNIKIDSKSGVSGAGRKLANDYLFCSVNENFFAYSPTMHRHIGEIEQEIKNISGKDIRVCFTPHLLPVTRGIFTSIYCNVEAKFTGSAKLEEMILGLYGSFYDKAVFVRFLGQKVPQLKDVAGTNFCHIGTAFDERTGTLKIFSTIDNLLKGAAGQALQNMNLIFNLDQEEGLRGYGIFS